MKNQKTGLAAVCTLAIFVLWTIAVRFVDVEPIGPHGSTVGFATLNAFVHKLTGVHMWLYTVTDWLGLIPLGFAAGFAVLGLIQWITRKSLRRVDSSLLVLGGFYIAVIAVYLFFETVVINYRPVLIDGYLEASYPSSTTLLVLCVMPTAAIQLRSRIRHPSLSRCVCAVITAFLLCMVVGRCLSGVHWLSDIVGGTLLSTGLLLLYRYGIHRFRT